MATIGGRIRERRIALGLSVDELAAKLGKNRATVYRYESDEIENFPISVIVPLARALQTTPGYLMGWEDDLHRVPGGWMTTSAMASVLAEDSKKGSSPEGDGLSKEQQELIQLFEDASPALRAAALAVLRSAEGQDKVPGEVSKVE